MSDLIADNLCVVCFHTLHPKRICKELDEFSMYMYDTDEQILCGCNDSISEEERGNIIVTLT